MVVKGKPRGNALQLADYLLAMGENERITILNVDGRANASAGYLKNILYSMELNSELTRSNQGVYHAVLNPNPEGNEDRAMTAEDWHRSADILGQHLTLEQQRRVIVLHEKNGRVHAHVVFERYDHEKDRMIDYKNNYKAHDKARFEIERELGHKPTPQKNLDKPKHKKTLTELWKEAKSGEEFIRRAKENGYQVAKGTDRPFRVVDEKGVSFDLVRQLEGVKTKEVREKLGGIDLMEDKKAIELMSSQRKEKQLTEPQQDKPAITVEPKQDKPAIAEPVIEDEYPQQADEQAKPIPESDIERQRREFIENLKAEKERNRSRDRLFRYFTISALLILRLAFSFQGLAKTPVTQQFSNNKETALYNPAKRLSAAMGFREASQYYKPS